MRRNEGTGLVKKKDDLLELKQSETASEKSIEREPPGTPKGIYIQRRDEVESASAI